MNHYGLHGKLVAKAGMETQLAEILLKASQLVKNAKGCRLYVISKDAAMPYAVWITEIWDSKEDHDASLQNPEVRTLIGQAVPLLDGPPQKGQELEILGGIGIAEG